MESKGKKRNRKNIPNLKKNKPSPVLKVDEETIPAGTISDNAINSPDFFLYELENGLDTSNSSSEDDSSLADIVLTKILNQKKLDLMESEEIQEKLKPKKKK